MSHGPLMLDLQGTELSDHERTMLRHPAAGGVILFSRNFQSPEQVQRLIGEIHGLRQPSLLVAVDQEGVGYNGFGKDSPTYLPRLGLADFIRITRGKRC